MDKKNEIYPENVICIILFSHFRWRTPGQFYAILTEDLCHRYLELAIRTHISGKIAVLTFPCHSAL